MKKIIAVITFVITCTLTSTFCLAATQEARVIDEYDLLTDEEASLLEVQIKEVGEKFDFDIVILTTDGLGGMSAREYAESYYSNYDYGYNDSKDGVIFLVSMRERDWFIATEGQGDVAINDYCLDQMEVEIIPYLSDAAYADGFTRFVSMTSDYVEQAATGEPYTYNNPRRDFMDYVIRYGIVALVSLVIAGGYLFMLVRTMNNVRAQNTADQYMLRDTFKLSEQHDRFLYSNVTKTVKPKENSNSGGGSSGGRGGKF